MKGRFFLDSNILIYAYTVESGYKHEACRNVMTQIFSGESDAVISNQIAGELSNALLNKFGSSSDDVEMILDELIEYDGLTKVDYTSRTIRKAVSNSKRYKIPFWDAVIAETMKENGIDEIITENEKDFRTIPWIKITNPFKA